MGVVIDGELYRGATGAAGEVGYLPLGPADVHDTARRKRGALEEAIGSRALLSSARELGLSRARSARDVVAAARRGEDAAVAAMRREAEGIALAVAAVVPVVDPELVVLGGEVGRHGDLLLEPVEEELGRLSPFHPRVEVSSLGEEGVLHGAVGMALQAAMDRLFARQPGGGIDGRSTGGRTAR
jgi:predicted NBD/HSP70 family sugar kinase